jgi:hypothetical protein
MPTLNSVNIIVKISFSWKINLCKISWSRVHVIKIGTNFFVFNSIISISKTSNDIRYTHIVYIIAKYANIKSKIHNYSNWY